MTKQVIDISVEEYTTPYVVSVHPSASLEEGLNLMQENGIRHLPVTLDENLLGIISDRDLRANIGKSWSNMMRVNDVMTTDPLIVHTNDSLGSVAYQLSARKVGSAIVYDENEELYGIFTTTDALNALVELTFPQVKYSFESSQI